MGALTDYTENQLVAHLFRTDEFTKPAGLWLALYTVAPTDSTAGTEVSGGSYQRALRAPDDAAWTATSGGDGRTSNLAPITWPVAPTADWGEIVAIGILDDPTAGNLLAYGALPAPIRVSNGDPAPSFAAGDLSFTIG
jgi:hypothetical protein